MQEERWRLLNYIGVVFRVLDNKTLSGLLVVPFIPIFFTHLVNFNNKTNQRKNV